jgi:hypothetical protein
MHEIEPSGTSYPLTVIVTTILVERSPQKMMLVPHR